MSTPKNNKKKNKLKRQLKRIKARSKSGQAKLLMKSVVSVFIENSVLIFRLKRLNQFPIFGSIHNGKSYLTN